MEPQQQVGKGLEEVTLVRKERRFLARNSRRRRSTVPGIGRLWIEEVLSFAGARLRMQDAMWTTVSGRMRA